MATGIAALIVTCLVLFGRETWPTWRRRGTMLLAWSFFMAGCMSLLARAISD